EELEDDERRNGLAAAHRVELGVTEPGDTLPAKRTKADAVDVRASGWSVAREPGIYQDPDLYPSTPSFFMDLRNAKLGVYESIDRLNRNHKVAVEREARAGDMTTVAGAGGQFAPPLWLVEEFVALARPGRVAADLCTHDTLPEGISSINMPKVSSGATTAVQA